MRVILASQAPSRQPLDAADVADLLRMNRLPAANPAPEHYNRVPAEATAFPHRDGRFLLKRTITVAVGERPGGWLDESCVLTQPYGTGGAYRTSPGRVCPARPTTWEISAGCAGSGRPTIRTRCSRHRQDSPPQADDGCHRSLT